MITLFFFALVFEDTDDAAPVALFAVFLSANMMTPM